MEKSAVWNWVVQLLLLGTKTLITTASKITDPNNNAPAKYVWKTYLEEKTMISRFPVRKIDEGFLDNFVEKMKLYHALKVGEKLTLF